ncbi:MAG: hypothetical protein GC154_12905 [bacterium]|nr:hypothetical protein [bacterium]
MIPVRGAAMIRVDERETGSGVGERWGLIQLRAPSINGSIGAVRSPSGRKPAFRQSVIRAREFEK